MDEFVSKSQLYRFIGQSGVARIHVADVDMMKPADVAPVVHGEWLESISMEPAFMGGFMPKRTYFCSKCGLREKWKWPYCHCGAKMDGGEKDAQVQD